MNLTELNEKNMTNVTSDQLRDISVSVVEGFLNDKIPLSTGLAKQAAAANLNSEQIQRGVEAVNTIAYLKVLGLSDDRTVEFPLAKFAEVMTQVSLPEKQASQQWSDSDSASVVTQNDHPETTAGTDPLTNKVVTASDDNYPFSASDMEDGQRDGQEKVAYFLKEASINRKIVEDLEDRSLVVADQLMKVAKAIAIDGKGMDKLASIADETEYAQLSVLVTGEIRQRRDFGGHVMFKEADLKDVNKLTGLFKEAKFLVTEIAKRGELQKRAELVHGEMTKQAGLISGLGYAAGKVVGAPINAAKAAVAAPFKGAARVAGNAINSGMSKVTGKAFTPKPMGTLGKIGVGAAGIAGSVGIDAAMYSPGNDATTGRSNDVWSALQRGQ